MNTCEQTKLCKYEYVKFLHISWSKAELKTFNFFIFKNISSNKNIPYVIVW
jgi:hypothetical protein